MYVGKPVLLLQRAQLGNMSMWTAQKNKTTHTQLMDEEAWCLCSSSIYMWKKAGAELCVQDRRTLTERPFVRVCALNEGEKALPSHRETQWCVMPALSVISIFWEFTQHTAVFFLKCAVLWVWQRILTTVAFACSCFIWQMANEPSCVLNAHTN